MLIIPPPALLTGFKLPFDLLPADSNLDTANSVTYTHAGRSLGPALSSSNKKKILVLVSAVSGTSHTVSEVKLNDERMSLVNSVGPSTTSVAIFQLNVAPSLTEADIEVTCSSSQSGCAIAVYYMVNGRLHATFSGSGGGTGMSLDVEIPAGGKAAAAAAGTNYAGNTWTGLTEYVDELDVDTADLFTSAYGGTPGSPANISVAAAGIADLYRGAIVSAEPLSVDPLKATFLTAFGTDGPSTTTYTSPVLDFGSTGFAILAVLSMSSRGNVTEVTTSVGGEVTPLTSFNGSGYIGLYLLSGLTASSGTVTITTTSNNGRVGVATFGLNRNLGSTVPFHTQNATTSSQTAALNIPKDGIAICISSPGNANGLTTYLGGIGKDFDVPLTSDRPFAGTHLNCEAAVTGLYIGLSRSNTDSANRSSLMASFA